MAGSLLQKIANPKRLLVWFNRIKSKPSNKVERTKEYEAIAKPFDKESKKIKKLVDRMIQDYEEYITHHGPDSLYSIHSGMNTKKLTFLYDTIKKLKPEICVETGVANGFSTAVILLALAENKKGKLYSIDICYKPTGVLIPEKLKRRWTLIEGMIKPKLKQLVRDISRIDFFLHDGSHTYMDMLFDYSTVWTKMPKKSILVSDDVNYNDAFLDFSDMQKQSMEIFKTEEKFIGAIRKKSF